MAQPREYAYYIKAGKLALVERDISFNNDITSRDYGPGIDRGYWKSPSAAVTDGLKINYTYVPEYAIENAADTQAFTEYEASSGFLKFGGSGLTTDAAVTHIVVTGSNKFNGLHKVKTLHSSYCIVETKYNGANVTEASTCYVDVTPFIDESFYLDLPPYLEQAIIFYLKANVAEAMGKFDGREYYMKLFHKRLEKHNNSRAYGARMIASGPNAIR